VVIDSTSVYHFFQPHQPYYFGFWRNFGGEKYDKKWTDRLTMGARGLLLREVEAALSFYVRGGGFLLAVYFEVISS